jgi:molybdopterin synthase catalytic subunit
VEENGRWGVCDMEWHTRVAMALKEEVALLSRDRVLLSHALESMELGEARRLCVAARRARRNGLRAAEVMIRLEKEQCALVARSVCGEQQRVHSVSLPSTL